MNSPEPLNLNAFTDTTKKLCTCSAISIFLIVLFIISPFSNFILTSAVMKIITVLLLFYTIYLNVQQTNYLKNINQLTLSNEVSSQLSVNVVCSYVFTLFIALLILFTIKSFF